MNRDTRFDFYKGFLMLGVIWGHTITALLSNEPNNNNIHFLFRIYDMPLFMLISGYFISISVRKYNLKNLLLNKLTTILFPTIVWSLIDSKFTSISGYYFLWAVFLSSCICIIVNKSIKSKLIQFITLSIIIVCLHLQPYKLWNMAFLFPYFVFGYYGMLLSKYKYKYNYMYIIPIFVLGFCFWDTSYNVWNAGCYLFSGNNILVIILFRTAMAILGMIIVLRFMDILFNTISIENTWFYRLMISSGRETLAIYVLQGIIIERLLTKLCNISMSHFGVNIMNINETILGYFYAPLISIIVICVLSKIIPFIKKDKYLKYLFGFKIN